MWVDYYIKGPEKKALSLLNGYYINCTLCRIPEAAVAACYCSKRNRNQHCTTQTWGDIHMNWSLLFWPAFLSRCSKRFGGVSAQQLTALWRLDYMSKYLCVWPHSPPPHFVWHIFCGRAYFGYFRLSFYLPTIKIPVWAGRWLEKEVTIIY